MALSSLRHKKLFSARSLRRTRYIGARRTATRPRNGHQRSVGGWVLGLKEGIREGVFALVEAWSVEIATSYRSFQRGLLEMGLGGFLENPDESSEHLGTLGGVCN